MVRRYEDRRHNIDQPILPPEKLFNAKSCVTGIKSVSMNLASAEAFEEKVGVLNLAAEQIHQTCS